MPIQRIAHSSTEIDVENYIGILRAGQSVSDTGWSIYADSAGVNPVFGFGGSPSITWSQNSISPLSGEVDLRLVKDASNRQGNGVSIPFTVANRHLGKVLQISFDAELISGNYESPIITPTNGTYTITSTTVCTVTASHSFVAGQIVNMTFIGGTRPVDGFYTIVSVTATAFVITVSSGSATNATCSYTVPADLRVSIIQDPSGTPVLLEPVNTGIQLGIANQRIRHIASFQTHISITSYRLCIHVSNASTVAYTVDFANFKVWEPTQSIGSVITDWQSYTPTYNTNVSSRSGYWQRVGGFAHVSISMTFTGSVGSLSVSNLLPPGIVPDLSKLQSFYSNRFLLGFGAYNDAGIVNDEMYMTVDASNTIEVIGFSFGSGDSVTFRLYFPIAGWGSSVQMSSDSNEGRVVAARYTNATVSSTVLVYQTRDYDTHGAYSNGVFTAPISGYYRYCLVLRPSFNSQITTQINESNFEVIGDGYNTGYTYNSISQVYLNAGQRLRFTFTSGSGLSSQLTNQSFSIERISAGSQIMAQNETVAASYFRSSTGNAVAGGSRITFNQRLYDTHGAVTGTASVNDNNWRFTAPMAGKYRIGGMLSGSTINLHIQLWKNDSLFYATVAYLDSISVTPISYTIDLLAGEFIDLRPLGSVPIAGGTLATSGTSSIVIERIGI